MADRKATNKYYPPDWDPSKGSINTYVGQHPLRSRARKLNKGILIVRFELPYDIYCEGCQNHVGMGVRFNAEKKRIGNYYTTPIFSFSMKCHLCGSKIEIHTNPEDSEYIIVSGARRVAESSSPVLVLEPDSAGIERSVIEQLEHENSDRLVIQRSSGRIKALYEASDRMWNDPYTRSKELRKNFRKQRKLDKSSEADGKRIADKYSLSLKIDSFAEEDADILQNMKTQSLNISKYRNGEPSSSILHKKKLYPSSVEEIEKNSKKMKVIDTLKGNLLRPRMPS